MKCTNTQAAKSVAVILASYPQRNVNNAEVYVSQMTTLIEEYPPEVAKALCHPVKGIVASSKFLPTIAETKTVADELHGEYRVAIFNANRKAIPPPKPEKEISERDREYVRAGFAKLVGRTANSLRA